MQINGKGMRKHSTGSPSRFQIQISQNHIDVYGSNFSADGVTVPNFRKIYAAEVSLNSPGSMSTSKRETTPL